MPLTILYRLWDTIKTALPSPPVIPDPARWMLARIPQRIFVAMPDYILETGAATVVRNDPQHMTWEVVLDSNQIDDLKAHNLTEYLCHEVSSLEASAVRKYGREESILQMSSDFADEAAYNICDFHHGSHVEVAYWSMAHKGESRMQLEGGALSIPLERAIILRDLQVIKNAPFIHCIRLTF